MDLLFGQLGFRNTGRTASGCCQRGVNVSETPAQSPNPRIKFASLLLSPEAFCFPSPFFLTFLAKPPERQDEKDTEDRNQMASKAQGLMHAGIA